MSSEFEYVEKPFILRLKELGWDTILSSDESNRSKPELTLRESFDDVIIESRLKAALKSLNDWLDDEQIEEVVNEIKRIGLRKNLIEANKDLTNLLISGATVSKNKQTGEKSPNVKILDFEHPEKNDFLAMNQFRVNTQGTLKKFIVIDVVLFVNGIPIGIIECKYPSQVGVNSMEEGINQLLLYMNRREEVEEKEGNERLFHYNQLIIATCFDEARMGTISSGYEHFIEWKDTYPIPTNKSLKSQEKLILGSLTKHNLIDLIRNFTIFMVSDKGTTIKVIARYQQYRAVNKALDRLTKEKTPEKRSGVIWHTQGSGKSLSMVFMIRKLRTLESLRKMKVVIVTDRTDLETQLSGTAGLAEKVYPIKNTRHLINEIKRDSSNLIAVTVQKFLKRTKHQSSEDELPSYEEFPVLNTSEDVLILVDEAHRSQGGTFGANLSYALPNSSRIAFTGTPLITDKAKRKTYEVFGSYIDKYGLIESRNDGATLQIVYEGKTAKTKIKGKEGMEREFEDMFADKTPKEIEAIKKKYGTKGDILEADKRIEDISKDIVKHYFENIFDNDFKAQVVASSRLAAIRYKKYIDLALEEYISVYESSQNADKDKLKRMKFLKSVVRITWENNDNPAWVRLAKDAKQKLGDDNVNFKKKFDYKNPNTGIAFLIVKDMLLTGFDAPIEQVMYVDKMMRDHTLLQAIARVNRVAENKEVGIIVDYCGITNHLKEALSAYSEEDVEDAMMNINLELPILKNRYEQLVQLFSDNGIKKIRQYANYEIIDPKEQLKILDDCLNLLEDLKIRADFNVKFNSYLKSLDILFTKPEAKQYKPPARAFGHINARARYRFRDDTLNILGAGKKVRELINQHLISVGINIKIKPVEIFSSNFDNEVRKNKSSRSQASEMEHAIRKHCKINYDRDPIHYKRISEKLEQIIKRYKDNWDDLAKYMAELTKEIKQGRAETKDGLDNKKQAPFYDLMIDVAYGKNEPTPEDKAKIKELTIRIVGLISSDVNKVDFWKSPDKIKELKGIIDDELLDCKISEIYDNKQKIVTEFMQLAKNKSKDLI